MLSELSWWMTARELNLYISIYLSSFLKCSPATSRKTSAWAPRLWLFSTPERFIISMFSGAPLVNFSNKIVLYHRSQPRRSWWIAGRSSALCGHRVLITAPTDYLPVLHPSFACDIVGSRQTAVCCFHPQRAACHEVAGHWISLQFKKIWRFIRWIRETIKEY